MRKWKVNYPNLPVLAIGFTRCDDAVGRAIQLFRGILDDPSAPTHSFIVTENHGQLFATEETPSGLQERSLEQYTRDDNRIVAMYYYAGMYPHKEAGLMYLAEIRRRMMEDSKYDFKGLLTFVWPFSKFIKPDPKRQWCSENCASFCKRMGMQAIKDTHLAPDQLVKVMKDDRENCRAVLGYYQ